MTGSIITIVVLLVLGFILRKTIINKNEELKAAFDKLDAEVKDKVTDKAKEVVAEVKEKVKETKAKKTATKKEEETEK